MIFSLSDRISYSRLFHPNQHQMCKLNFTSICPIPADDAHSMIFWLKNRKKADWRDKHDMDMSRDGGPVTIKVIYDED
jgi:hypothetical protein